MNDSGTRRTHFALACALALCLAACGRSNTSDTDARHYDVRGIVRGFAPDRATVEIEHETIPEFMPSMTMPFSARNPKEIALLRIGDAIAFRLEVTAKDFSIANVTKIDATEVHLPKGAAASLPASASEGPQRLKEGDALPAFNLTIEAGEKITVETLRGHPTVVTFIFTRCPMPNFCPLISKKFAELQSTIKSARGATAETRLLSITIDPQFDTPAVLTQYAQHENADSNIWKFATGEPAQIDELTKAFAVYRQTEGGTISHGLTTALISPAGKVAKLWRGNGWTVDEVVRAVQDLKNRPK
ncbi:MAG: SCO family protein [Chthoniobacterales bacterium]|nr:SCO family protein [Chthoniobacterales bacterium]